MRTDEIARLLVPFLDTPLTPAQLDAVSAHLDLLLRWNERVNLTAIRRPEEIVERHFGESFFAAQLLSSRDWSGTIGDLGSGGGFPGVPIAIYAANTHVILLESNSKKAAFLRELTRALKTPRVSVYAGRAEEWLRDPRREQVDVVTLRAVEKFESTVPLAASLLRESDDAPGTAPNSKLRDRRIALLIGASQVESAKALAPGFDWQPPVPTPKSQSRVVLIGHLSSQESA